MAKILITHGVPQSGFAMLKPNEVIRPENGKAFSEDQLMALLPDCDALVACGVLNRRLMQACGKARLIVCYGAGFDSIDIAAATEMGIPVANIPDSVTETTAELAMAHLLALSRRICEMDRMIRAEASTQELFTMGRTMGVSLDGMTLGIIGMGRIGSRMAEFGRFIGMRIVYTGHGIKPFSVTGNARRLPMEELLRVADVVSLHCPLTPQNRQMIGIAELALMKRTAYLINTSRGKLVDEAALIGALERGELAGAALDVFENEPEVSPKLKEMENVVLTPHIGSNTLRTRNRMAEQCSERILDMLAGRKPDNLLNPEVWKRDASKTAAEKR